MRPLFGADCRLRKQRDIDAAFKGGDKLVNHRLVVWIRPSAEPRPRLGLSVSRKVGGAVKRNRVKRCLREAFRRLSLELDQSWDTMVVVRPGAPPLSLSEATAALGQIFERRKRNGPGKQTGQRTPRQGNGRQQSRRGTGRTGPEKAGTSQPEVPKPPNPPATSP
ncbi:MAG: ribonuclease P protein component [Pseudohongiellaceae bacterium]|jgi:ribonuclease P protein component